MFFLHEFLIYWEIIYICYKCKVGQSRFTVVCMENNTINNNTRINSVFLRTHNCKPTLPHTVLFVWEAM